MVTQDRKRGGSQEFADIVPGRTTEIFLNLTDEQSEVSRAGERQPALVMLQGDMPGQVFRLHIGRQLIGRRPDCEIRLLERAVSGHHAEVVRTPAGVTVADLRSTNGTVMNGRRIGAPVLLAPGNLLKLGNSVFKYTDSLVEVELTESLHARSTVDELTGLWNRAHFLTKLAYTIDEASRAHPVTVIAFDVDHFAALVDRRGRFAADGVLQDLGRLLRRSFDDLGRYFARVGDDSFAIALGELTLASGASAAASLRKAIEAMGVTASLGVAATERSDERATALLARAEEMMNRARREGGNRVILA